MDAQLPKIVWALWLQGWDAAPPLVRACRETWERRNPGWEVRALTSDTLAEYVDLDAEVEAARRIPPAALSDVVRLALLRDHGGVWMDSTVYCVTPLDMWLPRYMGAGFFAFAAPGGGRMLSSWFLAAVPRHHVLAAWAQRTARYWEVEAAPEDAPRAPGRARDRRGRDWYFWLHNLFADAYDGDPEVRRTWDAVPKLSANGPHYLRPYKTRLVQELRPLVRERLVSGIDPVYKLSNRVDVSEASPDSVYAFLCRWASEPPPASVGDGRRSWRLRLEIFRERWRWRYLSWRGR